MRRWFDFQKNVLLGFYIVRKMPIEPGPTVAIPSRKETPRRTQGGMRSCTRGGAYFSGLIPSLSKDDPAGRDIYVPASALRQAQDEVGEAAGSRIRPENPLQDIENMDFAPGKSGRTGNRASRIRTLRRPPPSARKFSDKTLKRLILRPE
jgi:hypothetical protein